MLLLLNHRREAILSDFWKTEMEAKKTEMVYVAILRSEQKTEMEAVGTQMVRAPRSLLCGEAKLSIVVDGALDCRRRKSRLLFLLSAMKLPMVADDEHLDCRR